MATRNFVNAVSTTLNGGITNVQTTMTVASATGFPGAYPFDAHIEAEGANTDEIVSVTSLSAGLTYNITRASETYGGSSSASAHGTGAAVRLVGPTAGAITEITKRASAVASEVLTEIKLTADTQYRLIAGLDGSSNPQVLFGPGNAAQDLRLQLLFATD